MIGVEVDFIVKDTLEAKETYKNIFDLEILEATNFPKGQNEVSFSIYGTRFHMLDENVESQMLAPKEGAFCSIWFNVFVPSIKKTHEKALNNGCAEIQPVTYMEEMGLSNSMFMDPFGYIWMLHEMHKEVSFEEREELFSQKQKKKV